MKKLANVSPFILLLIPVFVMMIVVLTTSVISNNQGEELAVKSAPASNAGTLIKVIPAILK